MDAILVVNAGSSSVKFQVFGIDRIASLTRLVKGQMDGIGVRPQLRAEAKEKLQRIRPANLGQAGRISGIGPADLAVLLLYLGSPAPVARPALHRHRFARESPAITRSKVGATPASPDLPTE